MCIRDRLDVRREVDGVSVCGVRCAVSSQSALLATVATTAPAPNVFLSAVCGVTVKETVDQDDHGWCNSTVPCIIGTTRFVDWPIILFHF